MDSQIPSYISLLGFVVPAVIFIARLATRKAASIAHALLMALICLFIGFLAAGATISVFGALSPIGNALIVSGAGIVAAFVRLAWIKRFP